MLKVMGCGIVVVKVKHLFKLLLAVFQLLTAMLQDGGLLADKCTQLRASWPTTWHTAHSAMQWSLSTDPCTSVLYVQSCTDLLSCS